MSTPGRRSQEGKGKNLLVSFLRQADTPHLLHLDDEVGTPLERGFPGSAQYLVLNPGY